jgi:hypothetical protein
MSGLFVPTRTHIAAGHRLKLVGRCSLSYDRLRKAARCGADGDRSLLSVRCGVQRTSQAARLEEENLKQEDAPLVALAKNLAKGAALFGLALALVSGLGYGILLLIALQRVLSDMVCNTVLAFWTV